MIKLVIVLSFVAASQSVGRNPTKSDHALCRKVYCNETNDGLKSGSRVKIEAYNSGKSGSPCKTTCRFVGKIQKKLDPLNSADSTPCGADMYCQSGQCVSDTAPAASQDVIVVREEDTTDEQSSKDETSITKEETADSDQSKNPELLNEQSVKDEKTEDSSTKEENTKDETNKEEKTDNQSKKEETREDLVKNESVANDETKTVDETKSTKDESSDKQSTKDESTREERESNKEDVKEESSS